MDFTRCFGCMGELSSPDAVCPRCGYDNAKDPSDPMKQASHVLPCGSVLYGRYVVGKMLGQGGFGITYIGWNMILNIPVCIKEYYPFRYAMRSATQSRLVLWGDDKESQTMRQNRERFVTEAQRAVILRDLSHVVSVWDMFYENETAYIVMDYLEGETLQSRIRRTNKTLGEKECVELLAPLMEDLEKAHRLGIIHRDIKPDNIMLREDGEPVLLDMGAAKELDRSARDENGRNENRGIDAPRLTLNAVSEGFSPKEQYRSNGNIGPWTDVYAMCATIYYCVSGSVPTESVQRDEGDRLDMRGVSPALAEVLNRGLELKPEDRIQDMGELRASLEQAVKTETDYQTAKELMARGDEGSLRSARSAFASLDGYRDAEELARECKKRIKELENGKGGRKDKGTSGGGKTPGSKLIVPIIAGALLLGAGGSYIIKQPKPTPLPVVIESAVPTPSTPTPSTPAPSTPTPSTPKETTITDNNGNVYVGQVKDGVYSGKGTMTYASGAVYTGEWKDGKFNGQGTVMYAKDNADNCVSYEGEWVDGIRCGQGTMKWKDGTIYTGEFKDNKRNGQGTMTFANGNVYTGEWKDGKFNGHGTITYAEDDAYNRVLYEGEWVDDQKNGQGTMKWKNGNVYTGEWKGNYYAGQGTFNYANGDVYTGEFKNDRRDGQGTMTFANGNVYTGEWKDDKRTGKGTYTWKETGNVYVGDFVDGKLTGLGAMLYSDGCYIGEWSGGKKNGLGIRRSQNEENVIGVWQADSPQPLSALPSEFEIIDTSEYYYIGEVKDGKRNGKGICIWRENENIYAGEWKADKQIGSGVYIWTNRDDNVYVGEFDEHWLNGQGCLRWNNGDFYIGEFQNGQITGWGTKINADGLTATGQWKDSAFLG